VKENDPPQANVKVARATPKSTPPWYLKPNVFAAPPKGHQRSLRDVADQLMKLGFLNQRGATFSPSSIKSILNSQKGRHRIS